MLVACRASAFSVRERRTSAFNVRESWIMYASAARLHLMHASTARVHASALKEFKLACRYTPNYRVRARKKMIADEPCYVRAF